MLLINGQTAGEINESGEARICRLIFITMDAIYWQLAKYQAMLLQ